MEQFRRQIETKPYDAYPTGAKDEIHLVSYNKAVRPDVVGSYGYRIQKYPADIDIMEDVDQYEIQGRWEPATNSVQLISTFARRIKEIMTNIRNKPHHYLLDFKAGADERYIFKLGYMSNGILQLDSEFIENLNIRAGEHLYTSDEYYAIIDLLRLPTRDQSVYEKVTSLLRKHYILRWSIEEILEGVKQLPVGHSITLEQALSMHQLVKMDMAALVDGKFMEVSNIWSFFYKTGATGTYTHMTPVPNLDNVPFDIEKFYWSDSQFSPFKVIKRMFSYARMKYLGGHREFEDLIRKTANIISGDTSAMYQVRSELDTIVNVLAMPAGTKSIPYIDSQVDNMKGRLANNLSVSGSESAAFDALIDRYLQTHNVEALEATMKVLKKMINKSAMSYLIRTGQNPPPLIVLPTAQTAAMLTAAHTPINPFCPVQAQKTYDWTVRRDETSGAGMVAGGEYMARIGKYDPEMYTQLLRQHMIGESGRKAGCATCGGANPRCPCCHGLICDQRGGDTPSLEEIQAMLDAEDRALGYDTRDPNLSYEPLEWYRRHLEAQDPAPKPIGRQAMRALQRQKDKEDLEMEEYHRHSMATDPEYAARHSGTFIGSTPRTYYLGGRRGRGRKVQRGRKMKR